MYSWGRVVPLHVATQLRSLELIFQVQLKIHSWILQSVPEQSYQRNRNSLNLQAAASQSHNFLLFFNARQGRGNGQTNKQYCSPKVEVGQVLFFHNKIEFNLIFCPLNAVCSYNSRILCESNYCLKNGFILIFFALVFLLMKDGTGFSVCLNCISNSSRMFG